MPVNDVFVLLFGLQLTRPSYNIRHALGATDVNSEIRQTAASSPEKFWYFNNGITLVADEAWKAPAGAASRLGKRKEDVAFLGYKRTRIGDGTQFWQVRSSDAENPAVTELDLLLNKSRAPKTEEGDRFNKTGAKLVAGANAQCIKQSAHPPFGWTYCFNSSSGDLIEVSSGHNTTDIAWKVDWQEHSNFQEWSGNRVPLLLQGYNGKHTVLEVKFEEIKPLPQLPADFFASPTEATIWADCSDGAIWKLKERIQPEYPQSARMQHRQGTVTLYAVIGEDGKLSGLKIAHSAGQELDQSAIAEVSHWRYERIAACPEAKGRTETSIDVVYSLQN